METLMRPSPLTELGLTAEELHALKSQGFVSQERRGPAQPTFKLRFRYGGRQRVRSLGKDPAFAASVNRELAQVQARKRLDRKLAHLICGASKTLRQAKQRLVPLLAEVGYAFHGQAIRKRRAKG
jgi:hypothetical protein